MRPNLSFITWLSVACSIAAWAGVVIFATSIQDSAQNASTQAGSEQTASDQQPLALKMHTLAKDTSLVRIVLETALQNDPLSIAGMISQAGTDAGVALHVSDAISEGTAPVSGGARSSATQAGPLQAPAIDFTVEADGAFRDLIQAAAFLESLPVPSKIERLDFGYTPASGGVPTSSWHMSAQVRILTGSNLSS